LLSEVRCAAKSADAVRRRVVQVPLGQRAGRVRQGTGKPGRWLTAAMDSPVARILRNALAESDKRGVRRPRITDLTVDEVQTLSAATLQFLRTRPNRPSSWPGWVEVGSFEAGVNRWWSAEIEEPFPSDISKRLQTLRGDVYDHLEDEQGLIVKGRGQMSPIHLSPVGEVLDADDLADKDETITVGRSGAGFGDAAHNQLVEMAAMEAAIAHFGGWDHSDVSSMRCGWDITFSRGLDEIHAEVKGVSGRKPAVLDDQRVEHSYGGRGLVLGRRHPRPRCSRSRRLRPPGHVRVCEAVRVQGRSFVRRSNASRRRNDAQRARHRLGHGLPATVVTDHDVTSEGRFRRPFHLGHVRPTTLDGELVPPLHAALPSDREVALFHRFVERDVAEAGSCSVSSLADRRMNLQGMPYCRPISRLRRQSANDPRLRRVVASATGRAPRRLHRGPEPRARVRVVGGGESQAERPSLVVTQASCRQVGAHEPAQGPS
jgi:hypothetical protein